MPPADSLAATGSRLTVTGTEVHDPTMKRSLSPIGWMVLVLLLALEPKGEASPTTQLELGPMLGHVGSTEVRLWVKAPPRPATTRSPRRSVAVCVSEHADLSRGRMLRNHTLQGPEYLGQFHVTGLKPATRYYYWVHVDGESGMASPLPSSYGVFDVETTGGESKLTLEVYRAAESSFTNERSHGMKSRV